MFDTVKLYIILRVYRLKYCFSLSEEQTMQTLIIVMKCHLVRHFIWVFTVKVPIYEVGVRDFTMFLYLKQGNILFFIKIV